MRHRGGGYPLTVPRRWDPQRLLDPEAVLGRPVSDIEVANSLHLPQSERMGRDGRNPLVRYGDVQDLLWREGLAGREVPELDRHSGKGGVARPLLHRELDRLIGILLVPREFQANVPEGIDDPNPVDRSRMFFDD